VLSAVSGSLSVPAVLAQDQNLEPPVAPIASASPSVGEAPLGRAPAPEEETSSGGASPPQVPVFAADSTLDTPDFSTARIKITLKDAFERMRTGNRDIKKAAMDLRIAEVAYDTAFSTMFLPKFTLDVTGIAANYTVGQLNNAAGEASTRSDYSRGIVTGMDVSLSLFKYNLFNGWSDWGAWQTAKIKWQDDKFKFENAVRTLRKQVFTKFYSLKVDVEKLDAARSSLELAETILGLRKAEKQIGKATDEDISSAQVDVSTSRDAVLEQQKTLREDALAMNQLLGDPIGTTYQIDAKIPPFVPVYISADQAFKIFNAHSSAMRTDRQVLQTSELALQTAELSRIPSATADFSGVNVTASEGPYGATSPAIVADSTNGTNLDVSLAVTVSFPLYNADGFMNSRKVEKARIELEKQRMDFTDKVMENRKKVLQDLGDLKQREQELVNKRTTADETQQVLEKLRSRMGASNVNRLELRDALTNARDSSVAYLEAQRDYINGKIEFANFLGLEYLPGDPIR
jgi:outer membrane protein TolC